MASILASCCAAASTSAIRSTTARAAGPLWQVAARRHFSSSTSTDAQQQTAPTSSSSPPPSPAASLDQLIVGDAPVFSSSALAPRRPSFTAPSSASRPRETRSSPTSLFLSQRDRQGGNEHPYRLHVHASKHNTILSLCRDLPPPPIDMEARYNAPRAVLDRANEGSGFGNPDADPEMYDKSTNKTYGQTVARTSCGQLGFRKAQRSTFEAATKTALRMFDMIDGLEEGWVPPRLHWGALCAPGQADETDFLAPSMIRHTPHQARQEAQGWEPGVGPESDWDRAHLQGLRAGQRCDRSRTADRPGQKDWGSGQAGHGCDAHQSRRDAAAKEEDALAASRSEQEEKAMSVRESSRQQEEGRPGDMAIIA